MEEECSQKRRLRELRLLVDEEGNEPAKLKSVVSRFAERVLGRTLHQFQVDGVSYILNKEIQDKVLAMIQPPGFGKSLTYITSGCLACGVTVVIQPTLTLSADQFSKMKLVNSNARVNAFNLDDYKTQTTWAKVEKRLRSLIDMPSRTLPPVFLVTSPQCASDAKKPWRRLLLEFSQANLLRLVVLDELHLVREQGETLRPEFKRVGETFIAEVKKICPKVPLLLLTATCQLMDLLLVEEICSSKVSRIIWAPPRDFQKRDIKISMTCRSQYSAVAKRLLGPVFKDPSKKVIVYTDFEADVAKTATLLRGFAANHDNCDFDCLEISGQDPPEQKAFNVNLFCGNVTTAEEREASKLYRALAATSGSTSTGIDPPDVEKVSRRGCPPSKAVMLQELGRLLRSEAVPGWNYEYHMTIDVNSYARLVWRTESSPNATRAEKDRNLADHFLSLKSIVLDDRCLSFDLEVTFGRPGSTDTLPEKCPGKCFVCAGERNDESSPFYVKPLQRSLYKIFSESSSVKLGTTRDNSHFVSKLKKISLKEGVWADGRNETDVRTSINTHFVDMLVLQLIAAGIIKVVTKAGKDEDGTETTVVCVQAVMDADGTGCLYSDSTKFSRIPMAL